MNRMDGKIYRGLGAMKIDMINNSVISNETIMEWFPNREIEITRKKKLETTKGVKTDILLIDPKTKVERNGERPYILAIGLEPPMTDVEWISSQSTPLIQKRLKGMVDYLTLQEKYETLEKQFYDLSDSAVIGKVVMGIIHELNNPLQVMLGFVEDIVATLPNDSNLVSDIELIKEEIYRCCNILGNVKLLRTTGSEKQYQDIQMVLDGILPLLQYYVRKKKIEIVEKIDKDIFFIKGESGKIHSVVLSVLLAAIENCVEGSKIEVEIKNADHLVTFDVFFQSPQESIYHVQLFSVEKYLESIGGCLEYHPQGSRHIYSLKFKQTE